MELKSANLERTPSMGFDATTVGAVTIWRGKPDCQAGHDWLLEQLQSLDIAFLKDSQQLSLAIRGNLGESIAFCIGNADKYSSCRCFAANALDPLTGISRSGVDIVWIWFGKSVDNDIAIVQEVKVTGQDKLDYAMKLVQDYDKLFGSQPAETLWNRIRSIKAELKHKVKRVDLAHRLDDLVRDSPSTSPKIRILPTLIHDLASQDPEQRMIVVRETICGGGWRSIAVKAWAIGLSDLDDRLDRLAMGSK